MIQCRACHYQATGRDDLASHIEKMHGFAWPAAWAEAGRVVGVPDIRQERIDLLAGMVQDLRARLAAAESDNARLREEKHELAAHVLRLFGEDERPSMAIRALVLRARAAGEG